MDNWGFVGAYRICKRYEDDGLYGRTWVPFFIIAPVSFWPEGLQ
jgi:hypothetical protein